MTVRRLAPYLASFKLGARSCLSDRADFISMLVVYSTLLLLMSSIFNIMPIEELHAPGLTRHGLLWYFAVTEIVVIGMQGNQRAFGRLIADGQITTLLQRPGSLLGLVQARLTGEIAINMVMLSLFALIVIPLFTGSAFPLSVWQSPVLLVSLVLGITLYLLLGHLVGMLEIFGPYSQPASFILSKLVFTFGGLFFPVLFYPPVLQDIVGLTPFPAIIAAPANMMLDPSSGRLLSGLSQQLGWLPILIGLVWFFERRLIARVVRVGD